MGKHILDIIPTIDTISKLLIYKDTNTSTGRYIYKNILPITETIYDKFDYKRTKGWGVNECNIKFFNQENNIIDKDEIKIQVRSFISALILLSGIDCERYITCDLNSGGGIDYNHYYDHLVKNRAIYQQIEQDYIFEGSFTNNMYKEYIRYCDIMILIYEYLCNIRKDQPPSDDEYDEDIDVNINNPE